MKIYLIEITCADLRAYGVRSIASTLKQAGYDTRIIFLPPTLEAPRNFRVGNLYQYQEPLLASIVEICAQADLVGISFMTFFFDRTIAELETVREKLPFINAICFFDDSFFIAPLREIREFAGVYKDRIRLPFAAQGSPATITEEKMKYLAEAGLKYIEMGIQTGSEKIRKMYNRTETQEQVQKAVRIINKYKDKLLPPDYHFILDNPWETKEDLLATLHTIIDLPRPYTLSPASLIYLPGTEIYRRAEEAGLIKDEKAEVYRKSFPAIPDTYLKFLIYLGSSYHFPKIVLKILSHRNLVNLLERKGLKYVYLLLWRSMETFRLPIKGIQVLLTVHRGERRER